MSYNSIPPEKIKAWVAKHFEYVTRNDELLIANPFYGNDKKKFNISTTKAKCHDWRGDGSWAGPADITGKRNCSFIKFVQLFRKCTYREAIKDVLGSDIDLSSFLRKKEKLPEVTEFSITLPDNVILLSDSKDKQASILKYWLKSRGYTDIGIEKYNLHFYGMEVYWPYYEFGDLVYWQSRSRLNKRFNFPSTKIYNDSGEVIGETVGKGDYFYGFDEVEAASYLVITESIFSMNTLGGQVLASGGADLTDAQIKKLKILGPKNGIILSPDNDKAGINSIIRNSALLKRHNLLPVYFSLPPKLKFENDGKMCFIKDWNELFEHLKMSLKEIRLIHDNNIKKLTHVEFNKLYELI